MSIINLSINLDKIDKNKIVKGAKGQYINISIARNKDGIDQYQNTHYCFQSQTKEEREKKEPKNYLGNGREWIFNGETNQSNNLGENEFKSEDGEDDLPF